MIKEAAKSVIGYVIQFDSGAFLMADGTVGLPSYSWPTPISKEKAELRVAKWKAANPDKEIPRIVPVTSKPRPGGPFWKS